VEKVTIAFKDSGGVVFKAKTLTNATGWYEAKGDFVGISYLNDSGKEEQFMYNPSEVRCITCTHEKGDF
jgi:hypothetical protein